MIDGPRGEVHSMESRRGPEPEHGGDHRFASLEGWPVEPHDLDMGGIPVPSTDHVAKIQSVRGNEGRFR